MSVAGSDEHRTQDGSIHREDAEQLYLSVAIAASPAGPYTSSDEHLWDELRRIDQYVRAQTLRWRVTLGASKPQSLWGMLHVTDAEVEAYLQSPFLPPQYLPQELQQILVPHWNAAETQQAIIHQRRSQTADTVLLRLDHLQQLLGLTDWQRDIILVCLLPELDGRYRRLFGYLQDDASRTRPTVELVLQILQPVIPPLGVSRAAFQADAPLLAQHMIAVSSERQAEDPLPMQSLRVDDRIVRYLLGEDSVDSLLTSVLSQPVRPLSWDRLMVEPDQLERLRSLAGWWQEHQQVSGRGATFFLYGPYGSGRLAAARAFCSAVQTPLLVLNVENALRGPGGWQQIIDRSYREAYLQHAAVYWSHCEILLDHNLQGQQDLHLQNGQLDQQQEFARRWDYLMAKAEAFQGLTFVVSQTAWDPSGLFHDSPFIRLEFPVPSYALRQRLWERYLPSVADDNQTTQSQLVVAELLANSFQLTEGQMKDTLATARGLATKRDPYQPHISLADLYEGCRRQSGQRLMTFTRRIEPRTDLTFDNLILPEQNKLQLQELRTRIRYRSHLYSGLGFDRRLSLGKGLIALFSGSSGTGKTMAAELLAREQGVDLYKVDLSAVVSKYVGETEKNLSQVFAEAESANAILFFDEADALFGKRGEVKEAQDRWANMEINYLLQRVEEYSGVVILTSNLRQNIDEAFLRRIQVIVEFPFPDDEARFHILSSLFPSAIQSPPDEELRALAERFKLAGGSLKNIVIDAAFRALADSMSEKPAITLRHLVIAMAREFQKLGKPITKGAFGIEFYAWVEEDIL